MEKLKNGALEIEYRLPNIPQSLRLMKKLGISEKGVENASIFDFLSEFLDSAEEFVSKVSYQGKEISWSDALYLKELMEPSGEMLTRILTAYTGGESEAKKP